MCKVLCKQEVYKQEYFIAALLIHSIVLDTEIKLFFSLFAGFARAHWTFTDTMSEKAETWSYML